MPAYQPGAAVDTRRFSSSAEESARLAALRSYCVLDTGREARFDDLTRLAASICETPVSLLSLVDADRVFFKSSFGMDIRDAPRRGFCDHAIAQRDVFQVQDAALDPFLRGHPWVLDSPHVRFYAGAPLVTGQDLVLGTLCVLDFAPRSLQPRQIEMLRTLAGQVVVQLDLSLQAMRDPLTGLYNRRQMEESLHREILRARRIGATVGVMVVDVDNFKRINDTLGHEAGDVALNGIAAELSMCVREEDIACRVGGEEFVIILPGTNEEALRQRAETVRSRVEESSVPAGDARLKLTVSTGLATFPGHGDTGPEVLRSADAALYRAKAEGRNRVVMSPPRPFTDLLAGVA